MSENKETFYDKNNVAYECRRVIFRQDRKNGDVHYELSNRLWVKSTEVVNDKKNLIRADWICVSHVDGETLGIKESEFKNLMSK